MGGLAAAAALGRGGETTDTKGAVRVLALGPLGHLLLIVVAVCLAGYVLWCLARAVFDLDHVGNGVKGIVIRGGYAALGMAYIGLALAALQIGLGGSGGASSDQQTRDVTATLMRSGLGSALATLAAQPYGHLLLGVALAVVAFGLIAFGVFSLAAARYRWFGPR